MNYADARQQMKSGDLIALSHYDWASFNDWKVQAVRLGTQSEYSHISMAWVIGGRVFIIESVQPDIRLMPLSNMFGAHGIYWIPLQAPMSDQELEFALSKVGNGKYSVWQAIMAQLRKLKIGADNLWECAEFVIAARRFSGVDLGDKATPSAVVLAAQGQGSPVYFIHGE